jgi:hypothetical protein
MKRFVGDFTSEAYDFMQENSEEAWGWDFKICERPNTSRYGTSDANQCRKGKEVSRESVLEEIKGLAVVKNPKALEKLKSLDEETFVKVTERIKQRANERGLLKDLGNKERAVVRKITRDLEKAGDEYDRVESEVLSSSLVSLYNKSATGASKSGQSLFPPEVAKLYADFQTGDKLAVERRPISDERLEELWSSLDKDTKKSLIGKGKPPKEIAQNSERGKLILKQLVETGFRDEITGQPYSWRDLQPDHKRAITTFPPDKRGDVEKGGNLVMTHKGYNGFKGSLEKQSSDRGLIGEDAVSFIKNGLEKEYRAQSAKTQKQFEQDLGRKLSKGSAASERKKQIVANSALWHKENWKENILSRSTTTDDLKAMASGVYSRGGPSGRLRERGSGRGSVPDYPPASFLKISLLMNRGIPESEWPKGLVQRAVKDINKSVGSTEGWRRKYFVNKFNIFTKGQTPPTEISNLLKTWETEEE